MSAESRQDTAVPWTRLLGLAALELAFLMSVGAVVAKSGEYRGWWIAAAIVTQLLVVAAVVEAVRRRRQHPSRLAPH